MNDLRPENEILICVARKVLNDELSARLRALAQQEIDWDFLLAAASEHNLLPLLYNHLTAASPDLVPEPILSKLKEEFLTNDQCNLYLMGELIRILELLGANGIKALAFKGPVLAAMVYGDLALRQAGDLDVLILKEDFEKAKDLLQTAGYMMEPQLTGSQQSSHLRFHCEIQFVHHEQVSVVDLHWGVAPRTFPFTLDPSGLLDRSILLTFAGHAIRTFAAEDLLLYLCMNAAKDNWNQLESVALVAELLRSSEVLDWAVLLNRARESGGTKMLVLGLWLARDIFEAEIPEVSESLNGGRSVNRGRQTKVCRTYESLRQCALKIERQLLREERQPPTPLQTFRMNLQCLERKRDAVAGLVRAVLVPTISDWQMVTLPGFLYPLYYLLRPVRLFGKYASAIFHNSEISRQNAT